jgi:hypothetical protein
MRRRLARRVTTGPRPPIRQAPTRTPDSRTDSARADGRRDTAPGSRMADNRRRRSMAAADQSSVRAGVISAACGSSSEKGGRCAGSRGAPGLVSEIDVTYPGTGAARLYGRYGKRRGQRWGPVRRRIGAAVETMSWRARGGLGRMFTCRRVNCDALNPFGRTYVCKVTSSSRRGSVRNSWKVGAQQDRKDCDPSDDSSVLEAHHGCDAIGQPVRQQWSKV